MNAPVTWGAQDRIINLNLNAALFCLGGLYIAFGTGQPRLGCAQCRPCDIPVGPALIDLFARDIVVFDKLIGPGQLLIAKRKLAFALNNVGLGFCNALLGTGDFSGGLGFAGHKLGGIHVCQNLTGSDTVSFINQNRVHPSGIFGCHPNFLSLNPAVARCDIPRKLGLL